MPPPAKTHRVFGQATRYQRQFGGGGRGGMGKSHSRIRTDTEDNHQKNGVDEETAAQRRRAARQQVERVEKGLGVKPLPDGATERGWLYNVVSTTVRVRMDDFVGSVFSMKYNSFLSHPTLGHLCNTGGSPSDGRCCLHSRTCWSPTLLAHGQWHRCHHHTLVPTLLLRRARSGIDHGTTHHVVRYLASFVP